MKHGTQRQVHPRHHDKPHLPCTATGASSGVHPQQDNPRRQALNQPLLQHGSEFGSWSDQPGVDLASLWRAAASQTFGKRLLPSPSLGGGGGAALKTKGKELRQKLRQLPRRLAFECSSDYL